MSKRILNNATVVFKKIDDGIYKVIKDRRGDLYKFAGTDTVINALNHEGKVVVVDQRLVLVTANFQLKSEGSLS